MAIGNLQRLRKIKQLESKLWKKTFTTFWGSPNPPQKMK
jgi:hypothetical protein